MQINVVPNGSPMTFSMMLYPEQHQRNQSYIQEKLTQVSTQLGAAVSDFGTKFMQRAKNLYEQAYNSQAVLAAKAAIRATKGLFHPNAIVQLDSLDDLRSAQPVMQRYLMANPIVRELYNEQRIDGYSDTYVNVHGKAIGHGHYDYRRVMDGIVVDHELQSMLTGKPADESEPEWTCTTYIEDLLPEDRELQAMEQADMINNYRLQAIAISQLKDPTNLFGGNIGG